MMKDMKEIIVLLNKWQFKPDYRVEVGNRFRDLYFLLTQDFLDKDISLSISGLRRVGKTTILYQLINYLLDIKVNSRQILYFQFSEDFTNLEKVLHFFFAGFTEEEIRRDNFYIFLDELQYVRDWQNILKSYIDQNAKIKFVVTGSASIYLRKRVKESLAGRILDFTLPVLSFAEMIRLRDDFEGEYSFESIIKSEEDKLAMFKKFQGERLPYRKLIGKYLVAGEFPALLPYLDDLVYCRKYLTDGIIDKILQKDIRLFEVEKEEEMVALYRICCSNMAQMINLRNVSAETGMAYQTVKKYLSVLKKTFLIDGVKNRQRSIRAQIKSQDKVFSLSVNLTLSMLSIENPLNPPYLDFKGHIIENFVYNSIREMGEVYYYNLASKEVDIVVELAKKIVPIEVKSNIKIKKTDTNHLFGFMQKNQLTEGYLVYGGDLDKRENGELTIYLLPYWLF